MKNFSVAPTDWIVDLCIRKNWFDNGSVEQYEKMLEMNRDNEPLESICLAIWLCSKNISKADVQHELKKLKRNYLEDLDEEKAEVFKALWEDLTGGLPDKPKENFVLDSAENREKTDAVCKFLKNGTRIGYKEMRMMEEAGFWTDGDEILCPSEETSEALANFLTDYSLKNRVGITILSGWYSPYEDERDEDDEYSGYNYVTFE